MSEDDGPAEENLFPFAGRQIIIVGQFFVPTSLDLGNVMFTSKVFERVTFDT